MLSDPRFTVLEGDITKHQVDAIVNAANNSLLGGGGEGNKKVERVLVVCYTRDVYDAYQAPLQPNEPA